MPITVGTTSITFNDSTTQSTAFTGAVTSAVAGNGISVSGSTGAVTFSVAAPGINTVGSYAGIDKPYPPNAGDTFTGGTIHPNGPAPAGTWRNMGRTSQDFNNNMLLAVRVS